MLQSPRPSHMPSFPYATRAKTAREPVEAPAFRGDRSRFSSPPDEYQTIRSRIGHQLLHDDHRHQQQQQQPQRPIPPHSSRSTLLPGVATLLQPGLKPCEFIGRKRAFSEQRHDDEQQTQRFWGSNDPLAPPQSCLARSNGTTLARVHPLQSRDDACLTSTSHAFSPSEYLNVSSCSRVGGGAPSILKRKKDSGRRVVTLTPQYSFQNSHEKMQQRCFPSMDKFVTARTRNMHEAAVSLRTNAAMPTPSIPPLRRKTSASSDSTTSSNFEDDTSIGGPQHTHLKPRSAPPRQSKNSRYLREIDRRVILSRIARGEKQSALAKEFQVSRAAICNLNKHREDVWLRRDENPLAKHPKKPRMKPAMTTATAPVLMETRPTSSSTPSSPPMRNKRRVFEVTSRSVAILLTMVRARNAVLTECRRYADRLLRLVIEDALLLAPIERLQAHVSGEHKHARCGIALRPSGAPMLDMFHLMEPTQPTGCIRRRSSSQPLNLVFHSQNLSLSSSSPTPLLYQHNVFLFDVAVQASDSEALVDAVALLVHHQGAAESRIWVVTLSMAAAAVTRLHSAFPRVNFVAVHIDASPALPSPFIHDVANTGPSCSKSLEVDMLVARFDKLYALSTPVVVSSPSANREARIREEDNGVMQG